MCYAEDSLITTETNDFEKKKNLYELMGDGACKLKNYSAAIGYYLKMLEAAKNNQEDGKDLIPTYVSLYQTYKDNKEYLLALEYMWKEYELCKDVPSEAFSTLFGIAETSQLAGKDFWDIDNVLDRAREQAKKIGSLKKEKLVIREQIDLRNKQGMSGLAEIMNEEVKLAGINLEDGNMSDEELESESNTEDINTPNIGDDICLDDLSDSASETEEVSKSPAAANQSRTLRKRGCIAIKRNEKGETQLHRACITGNLTLARRLIDQGHAVNIRDHAGWLPLHEAANHGFRDIVELLLDSGASINDKGGTNCDGVTPLHDACGNGELEVVELLLDRGANATLRTDLGSTPLQSLELWANGQQLKEHEQIFCDTIRARISQKLERAGISAQSTSPLKIIQPTRSEQSSGTKRSKSVTPRKRILSSSSSDEENKMLDSENIETVESILNQAFPTTQQCTEINDDFEMIPSSSTSRPYHIDYKDVMEELRTGNLQKRTSENSLQPLEKISKRSGFLAADEVEVDNWLEDDLMPSKKKRKLLSDRFYATDENNRIERDRGVQTKISRLSLSSGKRSSLTPPYCDPGVSSTFENNIISNDDDNDTVDAFDILMTSTESGQRRKKRNSISKSSKDGTWRQQTSLFDSGFGRYRMDSPPIPEIAHASVSSTVASPKRGTAPAAPINASISVKVRVEQDLLNVPIFRNNADDLTIEWLAEEAAKRYYK